MSDAPTANKLNPAALAPAEEAPTPAHLHRNRAAFESVEPELRAMSSLEVRIPNSDPMGSAFASIALVTYLRRDGRLTRIRAALNPSFLDPNLDATLLTFAHALQYLQGQSTATDAASTDAKVDPALAKEATDRRERMLFFLSYWYVEDRAKMAVLERIRAGSGYQKTSVDLMELAQIYDDNAAEFVVGTRHYRPEDAAEAQKNAIAIEEAITDGEGEPEGEAADLRNRAWTRVAAIYDDLYWAHLHVFRKDPEEVDKVVPLRRAVHGKGGKAKVEEETEAPVAPQPVSSAPTAPKGTFPTPIVTSGEEVPVGFPGSNPFKD